MESEHSEDDRADEAGTVHEEETICDQSSSDQIFGRSIIFLKTWFRQVERDGNIHAFVVLLFCVLFFILQMCYNIFYMLK